jgi:TolB-like protein
MKEGTQRRLAAIVSADVVGYSRLMGVDEAETLATMQAHRTELWNPIIEQYGGRVVGTAGDSLLIEYASAVAAVESSVAVQRGMLKRNAGLPDERQMLLRIGINIGEVIVEGEDIFGDGVNISVRLQAIAKSGGIAISSNVHEQVSGKLDVAFRDDGEHQVKNIDRPVHVWRWFPDAKTMTNEAVTADHPLTLPDKPSIAVLPFENMSNDPDQEYFADGMSEDIITALSRSPWLFIIARNTTFTYKGGNIDVKRVARDLGVRYVLEGSVRKAGNRVRITAQLIDGTTGGHVWSERYDGELADIFDLQDEITQNVVASIQTQVHLTASEPAGRNKRPDLSVWELTMRGWQFLYDFSQESFAAAKTLLEEAIAHDPNSAEAHLVLAVIHFHDAHMGFVSDRQTTLTTANQLALRATRLDEQNEYAHWALGLSYWGLARHDEAIVALERALELNPNCSVVYGSLGTVLSLVGRIDEAIANHEIAIRSNPRDPSIFFRFTGIGLAHFLAERYDAAIEWADKAIHRRPNWYLGHFLLAASHIRANRREEAEVAVSRCREVLPNASVSQLDGLAIKDAAEMERFRDSLREAGLPE